MSEMNRLGQQDAQKQRAAERAAALVEDGMRIGLGSGTTAELFVRALASRVHDGLRVSMVSSSERTQRLAVELGLTVVELNAPIDLAIDGADAIEVGTLAAIKGRGGALAREKLVAASASRFVLVADASKVVMTLDDVRALTPVPIEVLPFGWQTTARRLERIGSPALRTRDGKPFVTDNGNLILDLRVATLGAPAVTACDIAATIGVVEHGLFLEMAELALVGTDAGVDELRSAQS